MEGGESREEEEMDRCWCSWHEKMEHQWSQYLNQFLEFVPTGTLLYFYYSLCNYKNVILVKNAQLSPTAIYQTN